MALILAPFGRWALRNKAAQHPLALRQCLSLMPITPLLAIFTAGCAMREPGERAEIQTYCRAQGSLGRSANPGDLEVSDIQIARIPDTGQGPGLMAHFRRHAELPIGEARQQPDLLLVMGGWNVGCEIVVTQATCPQAESIYASIASASIPVGYAFDDPTGTEVMHGTVYFLSSRDGHGNLIEWSYYGPGHPLQEQIHRALDDLEVCAEPAASAFRAFSPP